MTEGKKNKKMAMGGRRAKPSRHTKVNRKGKQGRENFVGRKKHRLLLKRRKSSELSTKATPPQGAGQ